jgi:predicted nucleotidyltransferase
VDDREDGPHSRAPRPDDVARICRALNEAGARYVLIGGFAMIAHGLVRPTKDIDLLIDDSPENVSRVKKGLGILADNAAAEVADDDIRSYTVVRVADEVVVDLMGRACGLDYAAVMADAETMELQGVAVPVASAQTLIRTKETLRPSDAADRGYLRSRIDAKNQR